MLFKLPAVFIFLLLTAAPVRTQPDDLSPLAIFEKTVKSTRSIKTMTYTMSKNERIEGEMIKQISFTKLSRNPLKVYLKQEYPKEGMEVLYTGGSKALINPNGFPWINLRLSPLGNLVRENQHHTIYESGYDHVINVLEHILTKYEASAKEMLYIEGDTLFDGHPAWKIQLRNSHYRIEDYEMQPRETVMEVARRHMISEYWMVENNEELSSCNDTAAGKVVKMPNDYAPAMTLFIDKNRFIPLDFRVYDGEGLFEHYAYTGVSIDPEFQEVEFTRNYPLYGF